MVLLPLILVLDGFELDLQALLKSSISVVKEVLVWLTELVLHTPKVVERKSQQLNLGLRLSCELPLDRFLMAHPVLKIKRWVGKNASNNVNESKLVSRLYGNISGIIMLR